MLADPGTAAWKTTMARLAERFVRSYEAAESALAALDESDLVGVLSGSEERGTDQEEDDEPGRVELMASLEVDINEMKVTAEEMGPAIRSLGEAAAAAGTLGANRTPSQIQAWSIRAARAFEAPAVEINDLGERMFAATKDLDVDIQRLRRIGVELASTDATLASSYNSMISQFSEVGTVEEQLDGLLAKMRPAEHFSVPLRRSLRPARAGLTKVSDSLRLIQSWQPI